MFKYENLNSSNFVPYGYGNIFVNISSFRSPPRKRQIEDVEARANMASNIKSKSVTLL